MFSIHRNNVDTVSNENTHIADKFNIPCAVTADLTVTAGHQDCSTAFATLPHNAAEAPTGSRRAHVTQHGYSCHLPVCTKQWWRSPSLTLQTSKGRIWHSLEMCLYVYKYYVFFNTVKYFLQISQAHLSAFNLDYSFFETDTFKAVNIPTLNYYRKFKTTTY